MTDDEMIEAVFRAIWPSIGSESALYRDSRKEAGRAHYLRIGRAVEAAVRTELATEYVIEKNRELLERLSDD